MKKIASFILFSLLAFSIAAQNHTKKIKVALIGTVHFTPSTVDMYKNNELAVSGEKRQKEINEVTDKIAAFHPDQICIEYPTSDQKEIDSIYQKYLDDKYELHDDEIEQLGFRSGKKIGLDKMTCVNYYGNFDSDTVMAYAQKNNQMNIAESMGGYAEKFMEDINHKLETESISDFLVFLNSKNALNSNASLYTKYFTKIGKEEDYVGTKLVSDWYTTNLHIYTNIIREIKPSDKAVLVIFGQGHIPILKHLFETNPDFEVIEVSELLK